MTKEEELDLIRQVLAGNTNAFEPLVQENQSRVYALAVRILGSEADACDAAQEAFVKAYTSLKDFRGDCRFSSWLYRITNNMCLDMLRSRRRAEVVPLQMQDEDGEEMELPVADDRWNPEEQLEQKEQRRALARAWRALPEDSRRILSLRELDGLTYEELAGELQLEIGTVRSRLSRARKKLCDLLSEDRNYFPVSSSDKGRGRKE